MRANPSPSHALSPNVVLRGFGDPPIVRGKVKPRLTWAQYHVVNALLEAGDEGLTKDRLDAVSGHSEARKILQRLHDSDPDWAAVIQMPGRPGLRYRLP
jgi:hypothetical protein